VALGEVQARCPHGAGLADLLSPVGLAQGGAGRTFGEEKIGIVVTAGGAVAPVRRVVRDSVESLIVAPLSR